MSDRASVPGIGVADLERRAALAAGGAIGIQDQIDLATGLLDGGETAAARLLLEGAFIRQGFSRQLVASRQGVSARAGIAPHDVAPAAPAPAGTNTVGLAIAELRVLARAAGPAIAASIASRPPPRKGPPGLHPTASQRRPARPPSTASVDELVGTLFDWLATPDAGAEDDDRAAAIAGLRGHATGAADFVAAVFAAAPATVLAGAVTLATMRQFLRGCGDLLLEPYGSPQLFRLTAGLDGAGLGPYLTNIGRIARRSADVFELAAIAATETAETGIGEEIWVVILSRALSGGMFEELLDDLGDRNAATALGAILERLLAAPQPDHALVMRIRDAALDNLDFKLAGRVQRALVELKPLDMFERRILASINASAGHVMAAEQGFVACLAETPGDQALQVELAALRSGAHAPFRLGKGYGSPLDRQLERLRRRGALHAA